eukprot:Lithocolla_globosa_v1_NODE_6118_length_1134_cov_3.328082.p1 type:complete len:127 gc:universal NODE_6118_length_1134_cov_3.328082:648-268(-)
MKCAVDRTSGIRGVAEERDVCVRDIRDINVAKEQNNFPGLVTRPNMLVEYIKSDLADPITGYFSDDNRAVRNVVNLENHENLSTLLKENTSFRPIFSETTTMWQLLEGEWSQTKQELDQTLIRSRV